MFTPIYDFIKNNQTILSKGAAGKLLLFCVFSQQILGFSVVHALTVTEAVNSVQTSTPGLPNVDNPKGNIGFILSNIFYGSADGVKNGLIKSQYLDSIGTWTSTGANAYFTYTGSVGIGTSTPGTKLDVVGSIRSSGEIISTNANQARFIQGNYGLIQRNDGSNFYFLPTASGDQYGSWGPLRPFTIGMSTGDVSIGNGVLYTQHGGNVGIGTITPSYKLDVVGDVQITGWLRTSGSNGWYNQTFGGGWNMTDATWIRSYGGKNIYQNTGILRTDGILQIGNNGDTFTVGNNGDLSYRTNVIFANTLGNVGIGTVIPSAKLDIVGGDATVARFARNSTQSVNIIQSNSGNNIIGFSSVSNAKPIIFESTTNPGNANPSAGTVGFKFKVLGSDVVTITQDENMGIGTNNPTAKLQVVGNIISSDPLLGNHVTTKAYVDAKLGGTNDQAMLTTSLFGENGDLPVRTTSTNVINVAALYGPFSYAVSGITCPSGTTKQHKVIASYVDNISTGGQTPRLRIAFSNGVNRDFTLNSTGGADPYFRSFDSGYFTETNINHASLQLWINGTTGPYVTLRKVDLLTFCR